MLGLLAQIKILFLTLFLGVIAGIIIHYYQLSISALKAGKHILYLLDLILWLLMILIISLGMLVINQGEIRIYTFLFLIGGGLIYFKLLAPRLYLPLKAMAEANVTILRKIASLLLMPWQWFGKTIHLRWRSRRPKVPPEDPRP